MSRATGCSIPCPECGHRDRQVIDSRQIRIGRRRRCVCEGCGHVFSTLETVAVDDQAPPPPAAVPQAPARRQGNAASGRPAYQSPEERLALLDYLLDHQAQLPNSAIIDALTLGRLPLKEQQHYYPGDLAGLLSVNSRQMIHYRIKNLVRCGLLSITKGRERRRPSYVINRLGPRALQQLKPARPGAVER